MMPPVGLTSRHWGRSQGPCWTVPELGVDASPQSIVTVKALAGRFAESLKPATGSEAVGPINLGRHRVRVRIDRFVADSGRARGGRGVAAGIGDGHRDRVRTRRHIGM